MTEDGHGWRGGRPVIGVLHPGAMGASIGSALKPVAAAVVWAAAGRTQATSKRAELADLVGIAGATPAARAQAFIEAVAALFERIGIPLSLAALGLRADQQDHVAEYSLNAARLIKNNPRPLDLAAMQTITRAAFAGDRATLLNA